MSDTTPSAGAMPAVAGATPAQTTPVSPVSPAAEPATATTSPATGDPDALGDAGKRALDAMKAERNAAVAAQKATADELAALKLAGASDADKAIAQAKKDGAAEVTARWSSQVRRSEVRTALTAEGITASVLDLATKADEFAALKVTDEGEVTGLAEAVKAFKAARPDLFTKPAATGTAEPGNRGTGPSGLTIEAIKKMKPAEVNERWEEVSKVLAAQR